MSSFCFTGPFIVNGTHFQRKHLVALAVEKGHKVDKSMKDTTEYLVCTTAYFVKEATVKMKKYSKNDSVRITPEGFLRKMGFL